MKKIIIAIFVLMTLLSNITTDETSKIQTSEKPISMEQAQKKAYRADFEANPSRWHNLRERQFEKCFNGIKGSFRPDIIEYDRCTDIWFETERTYYNYNVGHISVIDYVKDKYGKDLPRGMRIDLFETRHDSYLIVRRYCRWDSRGAAYKDAIFELRLSINGGDATVSDCNRKPVAMKRINAINAILNKINRPLGLEPEAIRYHIEKLREEFRINKQSKRRG